MEKAKTYNSVELYLVQGMAKRNISLRSCLELVTMMMITDVSHTRLWYGHPTCTNFYWVRSFQVITFHFCGEIRSFSVHPIKDTLSKIKIERC